MAYDRLMTGRDADLEIRPTLREWAPLWALMKAIDTPLWL